MVFSHKWGHPPIDAVASYAISDLGNPLKKNGINILETPTQFLRTGRKAQSDIYGRRILLGNNTCGGAV
jgi:hypothetical protein